MPLMVTDLPQVFDACLRFRGNEARVFHIGVDVRIGHPQGVLVGDAGRSSSRSAVGTFRHVDSGAPR